MPNGNVLCIRQGLPEYAKYDPDLEDSNYYVALRSIAWCMRDIPDTERAFETASHAAHTLRTCNGIHVCEGCAREVLDMFTRGAKPRE